MKLKFFLIIFILSITMNYCQNSFGKYKSVILTEKDARNYELPVGTKVDFLKMRDTKTGTDISIVIPKSGNIVFDRNLGKNIEQIKNEFLWHSYKTKMPNDFETKVNTIYISEKIISFGFFISETHGDAGHGETYFYSYNFDVQENKQIRFDDYFSIDSEEDKNFIIDLINQFIEADGGRIGSLDEIDFSIEKDAISFNLGQIESHMQGLYKARISKSKLSEKIKDKYR